MRKLQTKVNLMYSLIILFILSWFLSGTMLFWCGMIALVVELFHTKKIVYEKNNGVLFLVCIMVIGILSGVVLSNYHNSYDAIRYIFYVGTPILSIVLGIYMRKRYNGDSMIRTIFLCGILDTGYFLYHVVIEMYQQGVSFAVFRSNKMYISALSVMTVLIYMSVYITRERIIFNKRLDAIAMLLCLISTMFSFSRTLILYLLVGMVLCFWIHRKSGRAFVFVAGLFAVLVLVLIVVFSNPTLSSVAETFIDKMLNTSTELVSNSSTWGFQEANVSWRGYEMFCGKKQFEAASALQQLFGTGYRGVNVGPYASLVTDANGTYIPLLHNGYYGALAYAGIVGLLLYIAFFAINIRRAVLRLKEKKSTQYVLALIIIVAITITAYIVTGPICSRGLFFDLIIFTMLYKRETS